MALVLPRLHVLDAFKSDGQKAKLVWRRTSAAASFSCCSRKGVQSTAIASSRRCILLFRPSISNERSHSNTKATTRKLCVCSFSCDCHLTPQGIDGLPKVCKSSHREKLTDTGHSNTLSQKQVADGFSLSNLKEFFHIIQGYRICFGEFATKGSCFCSKMPDLYQCSKSFQRALDNGVGQVGCSLRSNRLRNKF